MASLLIGMISVCAFSSVGMALNSWIDFSNKDFKIKNKSEDKEGDSDVIKTIRKELNN